MSRWIWSDGGGRYDSKDGHRYLSNKQEWKKVNMNINWYVIENIAIIAAMIILVSTTGSGWWALLLLFCNIAKK
jgi:hypothetical protein